MQPLYFLGISDILDVSTSSRGVEEGPDGINQCREKYLAQLDQETEKKSDSV